MGEERRLLREEFRKKVGAECKREKPVKGQCGIDLWENLRICDYKSVVREVLHSTSCYLNTEKSVLPLKEEYKKQKSR